MPVKAVMFDAYGTLLRNEDMMLIPRRIWPIMGCRWASTTSGGRGAISTSRRRSCRTLREIQEQILLSVLRQFGGGGDAAPYVDLFFQVTTKAELYPEVLTVLNALGPVRSAIVSNADQEHLAAWNVRLPVEFILISEAVRAYKPHRLVFQQALQRLGLQPHEVLHVGDSDVDDVKGAKAAGLRVAWVNRDGRSRHPDVPPPDFEIPDLNGLLALL